MPMYLPHVRYTGPHRKTNPNNARPFLFLRRLSEGQWERLSFLHMATRANTHANPYALRSYVFDVMSHLLAHTVMPPPDLIAAISTEQDVPSAKRIAISFPPMRPADFDRMIADYTDRSEYIRCVAAWAIVNRVSFTYDMSGAEARTVAVYNTGVSRPLLS